MRLPTEEERRGRLIRDLRERNLWTREQLAKEAGVSVTTVTDSEEARTRMRIGTASKFAKALGVDALSILHPAEEEAGVSGKVEVPHGLTEPELPEEVRQMMETNERFLQAQMDPRVQEHVTRAMLEFWEMQVSRLPGTRPKKKTGDRR